MNSYTRGARSPFDPTQRQPSARLLAAIAAALLNTSPEMRVALLDAIECPDARIAATKWIAENERGSK